MAKWKYGVSFSKIIKFQEVTTEHLTKQKGLSKFEALWDCTGRMPLQLL